MSKPGGRVVAEDIAKSVARLERKLNRIASYETPRAQAFATNRAITSIVSQVAKKVSTETNIAQREIKRKMYKKRSRANDLQAKITIYTRPISGIRARYSIKRRGYKIAGEDYPSAFFARGRNSQHHLWMREGRKRLGIDSIKIPIADAVFEHTQPTVDQVYKSVYYKNLKRELGRRLDGYKSNR